MDIPETRYARSGEISVAYQVLGSGPPDLVFTPPIAHLELDWESPSEARFYRRLASLSRLIRFDLRGVGMSDPVRGVPTLESRMDDIRAVMDASESERAVIFGLGDSGPLCVLFATTYPERTSALVLSIPRPASSGAHSCRGSRRAPSRKLRRTRSSATGARRRS